VACYDLTWVGLSSTDRAAYPGAPPHRRIDLTSPGSLGQSVRETRNAAGRIAALQTALAATRTALRQAEARTSGAEAMVGLSDIWALRGLMTGYAAAMDPLVLLH
jgi:hypothetical protein